MTTLSLQLSQDDVDRIAQRVTELLEGGWQAHRKGWLTVDAAADYTTLTPSAIRTAYKRRKLTGHKGESGRIVFRVEDLDAYMREPE